MVYLRYLLTVHHQLMHHRIVPDGMKSCLMLRAWLLMYTTAVISQVTKAAQRAVQQSWQQAQDLHKSICMSCGV